MRIPLHWNKRRLEAIPERAGSEAATKPKTREDRSIKTIYRKHEERDQKNVIENHVCKANKTPEKPQKGGPQVDRQVLAAQPHSRDCNLPQSPRDVDREDFSNLPYADVDDEESASMVTPIQRTPRTTTTGSTLKCSPTEDDAMN